MINFLGRRAALAWLCAAMSSWASGAQDASGTAGPDEASARQQRTWRLDEFSSMRLVAKEPGAPDNQHPATLDAAALLARLGAVEVLSRGRTQRLFEPTELQALVPVLVQALDAARRGEDVVLLSTARRDGLLGAPRAITARLFVQGDALQFIVHDARFEFVEAYRRTHVNPRFEFGSRGHAGVDTLRDDAATSVRADWLAWPMNALVAPPPAARPANTPASPPAPAQAGRAAPAEPDGIEQRLITLERLRQKGLISEDEYRQKRREILQQL